MLVNKCLSSNKQELILIKFNYSNNYYYLHKLATYVYTTNASKQPTKAMVMLFLIT